MSIVSSELIWRKPAETSDAGTNGGRMSNTAIVTGLKNNMFPDVPQAERAAGSTKYRKAFIHVANDDDLALIAAKVFVSRPTPGDDLVVIFPGTQTDTQATMAAPARVYGGGKLNADVAAGATSLAVLVENNATHPIFATGDTVRVSNKTSVDDVTGTEEYVTLSNVSAVGNLVTLTFATTPLTNSYGAATTYVASCYLAGTVQASTTTPVVSNGGAYNNVAQPILADALGSIEQNWTISFTSASQFTVTGDTVGLLGTFSSASNTAPLNPANNKPYFTIKTAGWSGTVTGTTMTFTTHPAAIPLWYKRVVPAGAVSLSGDYCTVGIDGESA